MSIANQTNKVRYDGDGAQVDFDFSFKIFAAGDLEVYLIDDDGNAVLKTLTTHYTVAIESVLEGGTVTFLTAPGATDQVLIKRVVDSTQPTVIPTESNFPEKAVENSLDRGTMVDIQLQEQIDRSLKFGVTSENSDIELPEPAADKVLGWNAAGDGLENKTLELTTTDYPGSFSAGPDASKSVSPSAKDIYFATDTNKFYKCFTAGIWSTVENWEKAADVASATTTDLGAVRGNFVDITGTTTITGLGTIAAGAFRWVRFTGSLTLTHNATSLILPGGGNIQTAANDRALFVSLGSGNWIFISYQAAAATPILSNGSSGQILKSNGATSAPTFADYSTLFLTPKEYTHGVDTSTSDESTSNASYTDTTLSITGTAGKQGMGFACFTGRGDSSSGIAGVALVVDGTVVAEVAIPNGVSGLPICLAWFGDLTAASHTVKVQIKGAGGGSGILKGTDKTSRLLFSYPT